LQTALVLELLITDESNPRSVAFQLAALLHQIVRLQETEQGTGIFPDRELALKALNSVRSIGVPALACREVVGKFTALDTFVGNLKTMLWDLSDELTARYFSNLMACRFTASS
jgi:uncharacterized alpha-E superfamily protein